MFVLHQRHYRILIEILSNTLFLIEILSNTLFATIASRTSAVHGAGDLELRHSITPSLPPPSPLPSSHTYQGHQGQHYHIIICYNNHHPMQQHLYCASSPPLFPLLVPSLPPPPLPTPKRINKPRRLCSHHPKSNFLPSLAASILALLFSSLLWLFLVFSSPAPSFSLSSPRHFHSLSSPSSSSTGLSPTIVIPIPIITIFPSLPPLHHLWHRRVLPPLAPSHALPPPLVTPHPTSCVAMAPLPLPTLSLPTPLPVSSPMRGARSSLLVLILSSLHLELLSLPSLLSAPSPLLPLSSFSSSPPSASTSSPLFALTPPHPPPD